MGRVGAPLAAEVALGVAPGRRFRVVAPEALYRRPSIDERAVDRKVRVRQQTPNPPAAQSRLKEARRNIDRNHTPAVLRIDRNVPHRRIHLQTDKPVEQQVVVQLLHHLVVRTDGVEGLKQKRPQKPLRRDQGTLNFGLIVV